MGKWAGGSEGSQRQHKPDWASEDGESLAWKGKRSRDKGRKGAGKNLFRGRLSLSRPNIVQLISAHLLKDTASCFPSEYWRGEFRAGENGGHFIGEP